MAEHTSLAFGMSPESFLHQRWQSGYRGLAVCHFTVASPLSGDSEALMCIADLAKDAFGQIRFALAPAEGSMHDPDDHKLGEIAERLGVPVFTLAGTFRLYPVVIPKPWGREVWYTGIEQRGVAGIGDGRGHVPLHWMIAAFPGVLSSDEGRPLLLKVLDPLPDPVWGDLYFELHEQKREVYIVTHVDRSVWPSGVGAIRYGFSAAKRLLFDSDQDFVEAYLAAVKSYRGLRERIDAMLDQERTLAGLALDAPVDVALQKQWQARLPPALVQEEQSLRYAMEEFVGELSLKLGDVLAIPCFVPHSLQHGVRTVEFQTPVYERLILSFAQKVLTQDHWDTEEALAKVKWDAGTPQALPVLQVDAGIQIEQACSFSDFEVLRLRLDAGYTYVHSGGRHSLVMAVSGMSKVNGVVIEAEQALLISAAALEIVIQAEGDPIIALLAYPTGTSQG